MAAPFMTPPGTSGLLPGYPAAPPQPQGLLGNLSPLLLGAGMGLLSQGPSLTPQGPFSGLGPGLAMGMGMMREQRALQRQQALDYAKLQREQEELQFKRRKEEAEREAARREREALTAGLVARGADPANVPAIIASGQAGAYMAPPPSDEPDEFEMWQMASPEVRAEMEAFWQARKGPGTTINVGAGGKPLGANAREYAMPDGSTPPPTATIADVVAAGGRLRSEGEMAAEKAAATREEQQTSAAERVDAALGTYDDAIARWQKTRDPADKRAVDEAAWSVALARQALLNEGRELGGATQRALKPPSAVGREIEQRLGGVLRWLQGDTEPAAPAAPGGPGLQGATTEELLDALGS